MSEELPNSTKSKPAKVFHDFEKKPFLMILDEDLSRAASMVTDKDVKFMIRKALNILMWVHLKLHGIPQNQKVYEQIYKTQFQTLVDIFPGLPENSIPKKPPLGKATENKFAKLAFEHWKLVLDFCSALCDEHVTRFNKRSKLETMLEWFECNPPRLASAPAGYRVAYPIKTIPVRYRVANQDPVKMYVMSARKFYRHLHQNPIDDYRIGHIPEWLQDMADINQLD